MLRIVLYIALGLLIAGVLVFFFVALPLVDARLNDTTAEPPYPASDPAQALHDTLLVADLHNDFLLWNRDLLTRYERGHSDLPRLIDGSVGLQTFSVVTKVPFGRSYAGTPSDSDQITYLVAAQRWPMRTWTSLTERALYQAEKLHRFAADSEGRLTVLRTASDLDSFLARRAQNPDLVAGLLAIEGLQALEGDLARIDTLADAGFRMMGLTHLYDNAVGGSSTGLDKGGLTDFGRQVVRRLDERGLSSTSRTPRRPSLTTCWRERIGLSSSPTRACKAHATRRATYPIATSAPSLHRAASSAWAPGRPWCATPIRRPSRGPCVMWPTSWAWSTSPSAPTSTAR